MIHWGDLGEEMMKDDVWVRKGRRKSRDCIVLFIATSQHPHADFFFLSYSDFKFPVSVFLILPRGLLLEVEGVVEAFLAHQFLGGAALLEYAILHIIDIISHTDRGEAVGGKEDCFS